MKPIRRQVERRSHFEYRQLNEPSNTNTGPTTLPRVKTAPFRPSATADTNKSLSANSTSRASQSAATSSVSLVTTSTPTSSPTPSPQPTPNSSTSSSSASSPAASATASSAAQKNTALSSATTAGIAIAVVLVVIVVALFLTRKAATIVRERKRATWGKAILVDPETLPSEKAPDATESMPQDPFKAQSVLTPLPELYNSPPVTPIGTRSSSQVIHATVYCTFTPNLPDELSITTGELVQILREYDDGWALCVNRLSERDQAIPLSDFRRLCRRNDGPVVSGIHNGDPKPLGSKPGSHDASQRPAQYKGFADSGDVNERTPANNAWLSAISSFKDREELAYSLLASLPRSRLAAVQRRIAPLLQFDPVASLPIELGLQVFSHLPWQTIMVSALVCRRWRKLAGDQTLWRRLCAERGWQWRQPPCRVLALALTLASPLSGTQDDSDDEGMGTSDAGDEIDLSEDSDDPGPGTLMGVIAPNGHGLPMNGAHLPLKLNTAVPKPSSSLRSPFANFTGQADYKLLHQTRIRLYNRFLSSTYRLSALQTRGGPPNSHSSTIYCLQLYTYPDNGVQVLFTGSRDKTIREWNLGTGLVSRVIRDLHEGSVLSICVHAGYVASAGSDRRVAVWDLTENRLVRSIRDHQDSVLSVRISGERLVSCSKDRTVRTYGFPHLTPQFVLGPHRAAVNAVSIWQDLIVSGSGDRSIKLWDANTGKLLRTLDNYHGRGIAAIDFKPPYVLSGSSDKHLRLLDLTTLRGWSTCPDYGPPPAIVPFTFPKLSLAVEGTVTMCPKCGAPCTECDAAGRDGTSHGDLVRSVVLGEEFVISGSYDLSVKVWERSTGKLVADLTGGHTGRIFCITSDCTKIVSCGEDQRICIWDFAHGIDTSFVKL